MLLFENEPREDVITISIDEYNDLVKASQNWKNIRLAIYNAAEPYTDVQTMDTKLSLEGYKVLDAMKVLDRTMYKEVLDGRFNHI